MFTAAARNLLLSLSLAPVVVAAQGAADPNRTPTETSSDDTLQRIEGKLDRVLDASEEERTTFISEPLGGRTQGIEFNALRLLMWEGENKSLSGTYSRFYTEQNVEIALPFMYSEGEQDLYYSYPIESAPLTHSSDLMSITLDAHYRKYLGHTLDGFYLSGFTRAAHLSGLRNGTPSDGSRSGSETKLGLGVGVGYRIFSDSGLYWGMSLSVGRYLIGDSNVFVESESVSADLDDEEVIFDVEFFKFGYAF